MSELHAVSTFLHFGYLPVSSPDQLDFLGDQREWAEQKALLSLLQPHNLVKKGSEILKEVFRDLLSGKDSECHVLPLSGGLDSRAILGGLLENLQSGQIHAATFGTPETWDYEIGRQVARVVGVQCESIDLTAENWIWNTEEFMRTAADIERPIGMFDAYVNRQIPKRFGSENVYWSGFAGDPLAGSHLRMRDSTAWIQAKAYFADKNRFVRSISLVPPDFKPETCLPKEPFVDPDLLCYDEQIDFGIRQQCLVRHIVLTKGYCYQTPFLHPKWVKFIVNVPRQYRKQQWLYKEILKNAYPRLFSLPTKTNAGLPLGASRFMGVMQSEKQRYCAHLRRIFPKMDWGVAPTTNYIDFNSGLRKRADLQAVVHENVQSLKRRGLVDWIDIEGIWNHHLGNQGNYADALMLLASLEMNIVAGKITL